MAAVVVALLATHAHVHSVRTPSRLADASWTPRSAPPVMAPITVGRRACCLGLGALALPSAAFADPVLTPSAMLTAGQYLNDLKAAGRGLADVRPLLELNEDRGYEAARIAIRKEPVNMIRKACSKVLALIKDGGDSRVLAEKTAVYDAIKEGLGALDYNCRPEINPRPDTLKILAKLEDDVASFGVGLGISSDAPNDAPPAAGDAGL